MTLDNHRRIIHCSTCTHHLIAKAFLFLSLLFCSTIVFSTQEQTIVNKQISSQEKAATIDQVLDSVIGEDPSIIYNLPSKKEKSEVAFGSSVNLGLGQKYNVLEDYNNFYDSGFSYVFASVFFSWRNANDAEFFISSHLENTDYSNIDVEGAEQKAFALLKGKIPIDDSSKLGIQLTFDFQQSLDSLNTVMNETVPVVANHEVSIKPFWERKFKKVFYSIIELEWSVNSAELVDDRYESIALSASVKKNYGFDSEISILYDTSRLTYEEAEALALDETPIQGKRLILDSYSIELNNKHYWDKSMNFDLESSLVYKLQKDNGVGYDDFSNYILTETLQYKGIYWFVLGNIELSNYLYAKRVVLDGRFKTEREYSQLLEIDIEVARSISNGYSIISVLEMNRSISNNKNEDYSSSNMVIKIEKLF